MSLLIKNLTKIYDKQLAVNDISFEVNKGEIVGFLGPNGAGKSTTMKIATTYIPPSSGIVEVSGHNVVNEPLKARKCIGYLPEHNPLYTDLYLHEYLSFAGKIYGLTGKKLTIRIGEMIELCGLEREQNKKIESLSKGYRQRVGLAQSLLHDPEILILDEPTTGLDPNQIIEIRNLIKNVSENKTVLFSTHIMQEVQALCDRVIVINKGNIVADDNIHHLLEGNSTLIIKVEFESPVSPEIFNSLNDVLSIEAISATQLSISCSKDMRSELMKFSSENQLSIIGIQLEKSSLENVFRNLTSQKEHA